MRASEAEFGASLSHMPNLWRMVIRLERSDDEWFDHRIYPTRSRHSASATSERPQKK